MSAETTTFDPDRLEPIPARAWADLTAFLAGGEWALMWDVLERAVGQGHARGTVRGLIRDAITAGVLEYRGQYDGRARDTRAVRIAPAEDRAR